jgi:ribonucleoside-diphosphate reductase alpha chain
VTIGAALRGGFGVSEGHTLTDTFSPFATTIMAQKYYHDGESHWYDVADRVVDAVMGPYLPELVEKTKLMIRRREFMPGGRYLANSGRPGAQTQNCLLLTVEDNRESISDLYQRVASGLMTGAGIGIVWSKLRPNGAPVRGSGGASTGPCAFMQTVNEIGRGIMQGGSRRAAIWAGLHWNHADVFEFMSLKDWPEHIVAAKENDFSAYAPMDMTNISVILDDDFFNAYYDIDNPDHELAHKVYWTAIEKGLKTGEPGFSVDVGANAGEHLRNACTEVTSADDNDICNLGSLNLARIKDFSRFSECVELATAFLLCGTLYSTVPYERVDETRTLNRRLGLGLMGIYEWLVTRHYRYEPNAELGNWLYEYTQSTGWANYYADKLGISRPVKTRAIAPTGTIGILAETTTGIEPLFAVAYKRRYLKGTSWHFQYVIDATAQRLIDQGVNPDDLETAYDLARDPGRRLRFQEWVQQYVDHGISSTLNLPAYDEQPFSVEDFGVTLMNYLPSLRGVTMYPDGARGGQPLNVVSYAEAASQVGLEFEEFGNDSACVGGVCGI